MEGVERALCQFILDIKEDLQGLCVDMFINPHISN
jgi:hypothetical protein